MWQQGTGRTGKIAPTQIQIDPLDGYEVIRSSTRTKKSSTKGHKISNMKVRNKTPWKASLLSYLCLGVRTGDDQEHPRNADRRSDEVTHRVNKGPYSRPLK